VHVVGNTGIGGDLNVAGDLYVGGVQVVPGGGGGGADTTAIWLGTMTTAAGLSSTPSMLIMDVVDEEDDLHLLVSSNGVVVVGVSGIYEIQTFVVSSYVNSVNDGFLITQLEINGNASPASASYTGYAEAIGQRIATPRTTTRVRLNAGDVITLWASEMGAGSATAVFATLNVEKVD
jgi:hypothetical protein